MRSVCRTQVSKLSPNAFDVIISVFNTLLGIKPQLPRSRWQSSCRSWRRLNSIQIIHIRTSATMTVEWWLTSYQLSSALRLRPAVVIDSIEPNKPSLKIHTFNFTIEKKTNNYDELLIMHICKFSTQLQVIDKNEQKINIDTLNFENNTIEKKHCILHVISWYQLLLNCIALHLTLEWLRRFFV